MKRAFLYIVSTEENWNEDAGTYLAHGVKAYEIASESATYLGELRDISCNKDFVQNMANLFNMYQLHYVHLKDVVLDMLP